MRKILVALFVLISSFQVLPALELKRVILATNNNPDYIHFWPVVAPVWTAMGLRPTLALIEDGNTPVDESLGDVIRFKPIPGVPTSMQAQCVRLMLPALYPEDVCLTSDIDMIPISRSYFHDGAAECSEEAFLVYRDNAYGNGTFPMCYVAATGDVFSSVFGVTTKEEFGPLIKQWGEATGYSWGTDEYMLYTYVISWEKRGNSVVRLGHGVSGRLDRAHWWVSEGKKLNLANYIDCHCPRPYSAYKASIDIVVRAIMELLKTKGSQHKATAALCPCV